MKQNKVLVLIKEKIICCNKCLYTRYRWNAWLSAQPSNKDITLI